MVVVYVEMLSKQKLDNSLNKYFFFHLPCFQEYIVSLEYNIHEIIKHFQKPQQRQY